MTDPEAIIIETMRGRVIRGLQAGTLAPGDRLPSARDLAAEFDVDNRLVLSAYRQLAGEGLVEIRERGGVYVHQSQPGGAGMAPLPDKWIADTLAEGFARGVRATELSELLRRSIETVRLRALMISSTDDQLAGLARELREDFGLKADGITASALAAGEASDSLLARADIIVVTKGHAELARGLSERLQIPCITVDVKPDLVIGEWAMLLRQPVWAVVATAEFGELLKRFFSGVRGVENLRVVVYGIDDLSQIPAGAPTYVTSRVREDHGTDAISGRILPPARTIAMESAREIFDFVVRANNRALAALRQQSP